MLDKNLIKTVLDRALSTNGDFAELFMEDTVKTSVAMISSKVETASSNRLFGVGIRIARNYHTVYGYTNNIDKDSLLQLADDLAQSFLGKSQDIEFELGELQEGNDHHIEVLPVDVPMEDKVDMLRRANKVAREYNDEVTQVNVRLVDSVQNVWIANSEGTYIKDRRVHVRMPIAVVAANETTKQTGFYGPGGHIGYEFFKKHVSVEEAAKEAARIAIVNLHAEECPSGKMPVVIDNGFGGVIFHEACGHSLEATSVARKMSVFTDKIGEQIASPLVTAIDDGTIPNGWGSQSFNDEGERQRKRVLIQDGVLKSYMVDKINSRRMDGEHTGSGRRQSYKFAPTSRMSNTYIANGKSTFEEIIQNTKYGLYAKKMGGGSVNPATGDFNFSVGEGYMIRDGKIAEAVRGATLVGTGADILKKIDMVGNNLLREQGMCGSASGSIPADVGQPTIRVSEITVGGRKGAN